VAQWPKALHRCASRDSGFETGFITAWYGKCSASEHKALQIVVRTAKLPVTQDFYTRRCQRKALKMVKVFIHPSHKVFSLLPYGKWYWSAKSWNKRFLNSFYPKSIRLLKS
jgi:hypothetical protein